MLEAARKAGIPVIHTNVEFLPGGFNGGESFGLYSFRSGVLITALHVLPIYVRYLLPQDPPAEDLREGLTLGRLSRGLAAAAHRARGDEELRQCLLRHVAGLDTHGSWD